MNDPSMNKKVVPSQALCSAPAVAGLQTGSDIRHLAGGQQ
jgi:hypothetical protein